MEKSLAQLIFQLNQQQEMLLIQKLKSHKLNLTQVRIIYFLACHKQPIQKDIADYIGKSEATTANILKQLSQKNLIEKVTLAHNQRQNNISLTKQGSLLADHICAIFHDLNQLPIQFFRPELEAKLSDYLGDLSDHYKNIN